MAPKAASDQKASDAKGSDAKASDAKADAKPAPSADAKTTEAPKALAETEAPKAPPKPAAAPKPVSSSDLQRLLQQAGRQLTKSCRNVHVIQPSPGSPQDPLTKVCLDGVMKKKTEKKPCYFVSIGIAHIWSFDDLMLGYGCKGVAIDPSMGSSQSFQRHPQK